MTEPLAGWATAFVDAQADFPAIPKTKTANIPIRGGTSHYSYKYADLADILQAVQPILSKHGLAQAQSVEATEGQVSVTTRFYHRDGHVESFGPVTLKADVGAQAAGSAITYARRYALCAALGITPDEDDDGQIAQATSGSGSVSSSEKPKGEPGKPCPECGSLCAPVNSTNEKAPKWKCTNGSCTGHHNKKSGKDEPWVSWSTDPWKTQEPSREGAGPVAGASHPSEVANQPPPGPPQWVTDLVNEYGEQQFVDAAEALRQRTMPNGAPILAIEDPIFVKATENTQREIIRRLEATKSPQGVGQIAVTGSALPPGSEPMRPAAKSPEQGSDPSEPTSASRVADASVQDSRGGASAPPSADDRVRLLTLIDTACTSEIKIGKQKLTLGYAVTKANTIAAKTPGFSTIQVLEDASDALLVALVDELDLEAKVRAGV